MSGWVRGILTLCHFTSRYNDMKPKNQIMASNVPALLTFVIFTGVVIACISSFIPNILATFFFFNAPEKSPTLTGVNSHRGETSIVLRVRQKIPINPDLKGEALAALHLAMDMQAQGKTEKALKLFQHALNLDPTHADILNAYGEFLERHGSDIILAEHMYHKALIISPTHDKALENIKRALPVVEELDQARFSSIDKKRDSLYKVPDSHPGLRRAKKEAYFRHIYHMNALEGNTLTLSQTRSIIETRMAVGGKSLFEQNEVLGLDAALSFINNTLLGRIGSISMSDLLAIHKRVLGFVDPTEAGQLRATQVYVGGFEPPPPQEIEKLMQDFLEWLNSEEAMNLHPVEFAALAHYKLVIIHPFYDGNGRTSRLLMNLILMQAGFPPVTIKIEERQIYYDTLETANVGDVRPFVRFIATCTERTIDEFLFATIENPDPSILRLSNISSQSERVIIIDNP